MLWATGSVTFPLRAISPTAGSRGVPAFARHAAAGQRTGQRPARAAARVPQLPGAEAPLASGSLGDLVAISMWASSSCLASVAEGSNPLFRSLCSIQEPFHQEFHTPILRISRWVFGLGFGFFWCFKPYFGFCFSDTQILSLGVFFVAAAMSMLVCSGISVHIPSC